MIMRIMMIILILLFICLPVGAKKTGVNISMPLVEETLRYLRSQALQSVKDACFLRAGAMRVCGENLSRPGCRPLNMSIPDKEATGPDATRAWRRILESAMAYESMQQGESFDKTVFQRFVMDGMVEELHDSNSFYLVPSVYRKIANIPSDFVGFGLKVVADKKMLRVSVVHEKSPASKAGLSSGDQIVRVNGLPVTGYNRPLALAAIWGAEGKTIELTLEKPDGSNRKVELVYQPWTFRSFQVEEQDNVAVIRVRYFDKGLVNALGHALSRPLKGLVIDLRDATSGDENEMVGLADILIGAGSVGSKKARQDLGNRVWTAKAESQSEQLYLPVAMIINESTSDLAEVLAAAVRKSNRAILIGKTTAGQDTLETLRPFSDGSAIQVTSTRLYGPDESSLQKGVTPHLKTDRLKPVALALAIMATTKGARLEQLLDASRNALKQP